MRRSSASLALLLALAAVPACGSGPRELVVYSGRSQELIGPILERFNDESNVPIAVRYGGSAELALLLAEEGANSPADVFLSQSPGAVGFLLSQGALARLPDDVLELVDDRFRDPGGRWIGISGRQRTLVYNRELVDPADLPPSVFDVVGEPYAGQVAVAPTNASFQDFVTAMRQVAGDEATLEWLTGLADDGAPTYANNNAIVEAVSRGEVPMGLVNHYYNERFLAEDPDLPSRNYVFPDGDLGALLLESAAGVLATSDQPDDAAAFVRYLLSPQAQEFFALETYEYPLAAGVQPATDLPPLDSLDLPRVDVSALGEELGRTTELIRQSGLESR